MTRAHALFPELDPGEASRLDFAVAFKERLMGSATRKLQASLETDGFADARHRPRREWTALLGRLNADARFQHWSALRRALQDFYVDVTADCVDRQLPQLIAAGRQQADGETLGSLRLDPSISMPDYQTGVDIHFVPGGYALQRVPDDLYPGARSDLGSAVFAMRCHGALHDDKGAVGAREIQARFPNLEPRRILDLGCTAGNSTLPYVDAFAEAEVFAIDLSAPCLRYAYGRAEALGKRVHFSQQNAERTSFPDGWFDLVVSHILLHETCASAVANIFREAHRLLAPSGAMLHLEVPTQGTDALDQCLRNWDAHCNNEPFWAALGELDIRTLTEQAGFDPATVFDDLVSSARGKRGGWRVFGGRKPAP